MGANTNGSNSAVLEPGESSRTESRNTERLIAYLDKLADVEPAPVRVTEKVLALVACFLAVGYLEGGELGVQIVRERQQVLERGCVAQYAAGERYAKRKPLACAPMVEANHILTLPLVAR
jgi:hypothetical protein